MKMEFWSCLEYWKHAIGHPIDPIYLNDENGIS